MGHHKKLLLPLISALLLIWGFVVHPTFAAGQNKYFDFGPYYNQPQVLGFTFSSSENLPAPELPANLTFNDGGTLPGNPFYIFERAAENVQLAFTFDPVSREDLRLGFAEERLSEASSLMAEGKVALASSAIDDYNRSFENVSQTLSNLAVKGDPGAESLAARVEQAGSAQTIFAQSLALTAVPAQAQIWSAVAKTAQEALDKVAQVQGEPAVPDALNQSIQKLKSEGLISEEESNKIYNLGSRSEVREELDKLASAGQFPASELIQLDSYVNKNYPDFYKGIESNLQVAELRYYQTLPQPSDKIVEDIKKWHDNPAAPPSNDIRPYLWYNRAGDLAKEVDLSNFPESQQTEVAKLYPQAITSNPTYVPPPSLTPTPSSTPTADQTSTPSSQQTSPTPEPSPVGANALPYLQEERGALPGQPTYYLKRFGENFRYTFTFDGTEKARLRMQGAERRLAEADKLSKESSKDKNYDVLYEGVIRDYQKAMSDASTLLKNSGKDKKAQELAEKFEGQAARHEVVFEKGLLETPKDPKLITEAIKTAEDALDTSADIQGKPAIPPALANRLDDLKAQGLLLPEETEDIVRSASREEAREKVRKLVDQGTFPLADSKKMDEAQVFGNPSDYNQLVEVRKVEELQKLRSVQREFAQTPTFKANASQLGQKEATLLTSIDPTLIKPEDLGGRQDLVDTYNKIASSVRPINLGQFGPEATPGAQPSVTPPKPADAVLTTCPEGAVFKQFQGCVWADTGKNINDYEQYRCDGPRQYYSFAARKCVAYEPGEGFGSDSQPTCPLGYTWTWQTQSCQTSTGGILPWPSPTPQPEPIDDKEREQRSKRCPEGSTYKSPNGCVWDENGKPLYDTDQYRCRGKGQYYSFEQKKCITNPKEGTAYPDDAAPKCKEEGNYWSWVDGKCIKLVEPISYEEADVNIPKPGFATPGSRLYPLKQFGEAFRLATAFSPEAKEAVRADQARERLAEGYAALEAGDKEAFGKSLASYTAKMQELYNDLSKSSLSDSAKKAIGEKLAKEATEQNLILQKIEVVAKAEDSSALSAASSTVILGVDKAADLSGEPPIPDEVKTKIEGLPEQMISGEDKKKLLETGSRVEARLKVGELVAKGGLVQADGAFLNEDFNQVDRGAQWKIEELKRLEEVAGISEQKKEIEETIKKNEEVVQKLTEFQKTYEPGNVVPSDIRPYIRLTRIEEVAQTIRPDIVRLEDFSNRKDLVLAVATLQEEFKPTKEAIQKVEEFRRKNPNISLPPELARIEALSFSLGIRSQAQACFLPSPPFPANTPCPPPGSAIPVASYTASGSTYGGGSQGGWYSGLASPAYQSSYSWQSSVDRDGKPYVYGQGPAAVGSGICPDGYHWMYDSGGWCMSNSGNYSAPSASNVYTPSGPASPGYTPYSSYYTAPGAYPSTSGYPVGDNSPTDGCSYGYDRDGQGNCIRNSYPSSSSYSYGAPSYYGSAPNYYTTNPPSGTVPGSGPKPTAPGQCPSGFHWMSDSGGWCMADGGTYVPSGSYPYTSYTSAYPSGTATSSTPPSGGYNCGSQPYDPVTKKCKDGACPGGFNWDGSKCVAGGTYYSGSNYPGTSYYGTSPTNCGSGYWWNGYSCQPSSGTGANCTYPSGGCTGYGAWFDYSTCSCKTTTSSSGSYSSGGSYYSGWSGSSCTPPSTGCGSSSYWDYGSCSCRSSGSYYSGSGTSYGGSSCSPPSGGCGSGWFDYSSCSCKTSSSQGCYNVSASSCGSGWYFDSAACTCRQSTTSSGSSGSTTTSSGTSSSGSSSGSCPSGYHWMSDNGGWCMSDGGSGSTTSSGGSTSTSTSTSTTTSTPPPSSEPTPAPSTSTQSSPPPPSSSGPAPTSSP